MYMWYLMYFLYIMTCTVWRYVFICWGSAPSRASRTTWTPPTWSVAQGAPSQGTAERLGLRKALDTIIQASLYICDIYVIYYLHICVFGWLFAVYIEYLPVYIQWICASIYACLYVFRGIDCTWCWFRSIHMVDNDTLRRIYVDLHGGCEAL